MNLIVAVDENWAIGNRNKLLVSIPADMKFFREMTKGNVVVMGRKTMESFPGGQPLKKRTNIVLSRDESYQVKDAVVVHSLEELLEQLKSFPEESIYVIGGESIYRMLLHTARRRISQGSVTAMRRIPISRIWMRIQNGSWKMRARSRHILTWNMFLRDIEENRPRKSLTTDPATSYNGSNYFNETEKCSDWEEYLATGCKERRRMVEVSVKAGGNWPTSSGLKGFYSIEEVRCE